MKKVVIVLVVLVLIAGGVAGGYFLSQKNSEKGNEAKEVVKEQKENWNPYSNENNQNVKLQEFILSAAGGEFVAKMNVTISLKDKEALYKFEGKEEVPVEKEEEKEHKSSDEVHIATPMETVINSEIGAFMLSTDEKILKDKELLEKELKQDLNNKLGLGNDFIKDVYIENLVIQ